MPISQKICRQIKMVPIILSVAYWAGFLLAISEPVRMMHPPRTVQIPLADAFTNALSGYLIIAVVTSIPFWLTASEARERITTDELNIYSIRGVVAGFSIVTVVYWFIVSLPITLADVDSAGAAQAIFFLTAAAIVVGGVFAFLGWVVGRVYEEIRKRQRQTTGPRSHPKNLWW